MKRQQILTQRERMDTVLGMAIALHMADLGLLPGSGHLEVSSVKETQVISKNGTQDNSMDRAWRLSENGTQGCF